MKALSKTLRGIYINYIEWTGLFVVFLSCEIYIGGYYIMKGFWKTIVLFYDAWTSVSPCASCLVQPMCTKVCDRESEHIWLHAEYDEKIEGIKDCIKHIDYTEIFEKCCTVLFITIMASLLIFEVGAIVFVSIQFFK
jgi:hypothetical protein